MSIIVIGTCLSVLLDLLGDQCEMPNRYSRSSGFASGFLVSNETALKKVFQQRGSRRTHWPGGCVRYVCTYSLGTSHTSKLQDDVRVKNSEERLAPSSYVESRKCQSLHDKINLKPFHLPPSAACVKARTGITTTQLLLRKNNQLLFYDQGYNMLTPPRKWTHKSYLIYSYILNILGFVTSLRVSEWRTFCFFIRTIEDDVTMLQMSYVIIGVVNCKLPQSDINITEDVTSISLH